MAQMTPAGARVIDPIVTEVVRGYTHPARVGDALFPRVPVTAAGGKVIEFDRNSFLMAQTMRAPGSNVKRVNIGYAGKPFALENHALEGVVPFEIMREAAEVPGIDLARESVQQVMDTMTLSLEYQQAALATDAAQYAAANKITLAGTDQWDNAASKPAVQIRAAAEAIRKATGMRPNTLLLGAVPYAALRENPSVLERIKYTGRDNITTDILATLFDVPNVVVGDSVYLTDEAAQTFTDVWGNHAILAYVAPAGARSQRTPSYGYTYVMDGHPYAEEPYAEKQTRSWVYPITFERAPVLAGAAAGYLFRTVSSTG